MDNEFSKAKKDIVESGTEFCKTQNLVAPQKKAISKSKWVLYFKKFSF
jgi:hypothetical protein